jgi:membrane-bound serine protease (ClpP class)
MKAKIENDSAAFMRSYVAKRGRNVEVAETAVRESKSFTDAEALKSNLINSVASDEQDLLNQLQGKPIRRFNGTEIKLDVLGQPIRDYDMTLKERILAYIMDPNVAFILLAIGALALYAEFNHPGAVLPGTVGVIFILLAAFALNLLPVRHAALLMILAAFILFGLEAKFASHGILGIGGIVMLTLGALLLVDAPIPEMRVRLLTALAGSMPVGMSWNDHDFPDGNRPQSTAQQGCNRTTRHDWRGRYRKDSARSARQSLRPWRTLGRNLAGHCGGR